MNIGRLVSKNSAKAYLRGKGLRISKRLMVQLDAKVRELLEGAAKRAGGNGRSTVMPLDL